MGENNTFKLWIVQGDRVWFQLSTKRLSSDTGRLHVAAYGDRDSMLQEITKQLGIEINLALLEETGKPNVFVYRADGIPHFKTGDCVQEMVSVAVEDYDKLLRTGEYVPGISYKCEGTPTRISTTAFGPRDFCQLDKEEWTYVETALYL